MKRDRRRPPHVIVPAPVLGAEPEPVEALFSTTTPSNKEPEMSTVPAVPDSPSTALATIPKGLEAAFSVEEWAGMSLEERGQAMLFFAEEDAATTDGLQVAFPRWKFPTSGGTRFVMDIEGDDPPEEKELRGIVVAKIPGRAFYEGKMITKGKPPLCASQDGLVPDVVPSPAPGANGARTCAACPHAQWGSGTDEKGNPSRGQACKFRIRAFFLRDGLPIPEYISLPPTAAKPFSQYAIQLRQLRTPLIAVETIFGLTKATNSGGTEYQALTLKVGRKLTFAEARAARDMASTFEQHMKRAGIPVDDAPDTEPEVLNEKGERIA